MLKRKGQGIPGQRFGIIMLPFTVRLQAEKPEFFNVI